MVVNPDLKTTSTKNHEDESDEYTDGFYSSASDDFVPHTARTNLSPQQEPELVLKNQTTLNIARTLYDSSG